ncbi:CASP-like protein 4D1 [Nicotiana tomentosiformis]|uniref:CASP-like protein 4D1 n=1 Tax=Nicotiana tomentosiformis TaxID=4098 RepID=UPI00051AE8CB|nr:CASP-like protein 4D1 [Nicotiana tomentosiformis]
MADLPQYDFNEKPSSSLSSNKMPLFTLLARVITLAACVISLIVLQNNEITWMYNGMEGGKFNYEGYSSYRYMFGVLVAGIIYTIWHIPFAAYYLVAKKRLVDHQGFRMFEFFGDKIILAVLATGAGAALGATVELSKAHFPDYYSKQMHNFLSVMYAPSALLVAAFVSSGISSVLSSLNLHKSDQD